MLGPSLPYIAVYSCCYIPDISLDCPNTAAKSGPLSGNGRRASATAGLLINPFLE